MKSFVKHMLFMLAFLPLAAFSQAPTSYDSDGDNVPDSIDECIYVKGLSKYQGCPVEKKITATDRDGDGVADAEDACPDIFGLLTAKGCPEVPAGSGTHAGESSDNALGAGINLFATTSSSERADLADFREKMRLILADSKNGFADIKSKASGDHIDTVFASACLPGAYVCYINNGTRVIYCADYGSYTDGKLASEKADELKRKLLITLGESEWHYSMLGKNKYVEEYQIWKKTNDSTYPRIRTYVKKADDVYRVYLTIEEI